MEVPIILVHIPAVLRPLSQGAATLHVRAMTVDQALASLVPDYPALARSIRSEDGEIRPHVNVFVNRDHIRSKNGRATVLNEGDVILILPSISGG